ncbi:MAG: type I-E CRISPR-associated protein Cas7/Cse4/CasC [Desulfoprunum sp.]|nr:type I-E CRISPR-associated protein Cas7/Cse4/CasC [Desulfoprunum sp.]
MDNNFINFHILISHSPSCLNRDDMNMQKSAIFGGKRRVRISSQSLKRTMRKSPYYTQHLGEATIRTKHLSDLKNVLVMRLSERFEAPLILKTLALLAGKELKAEVAMDGDAVAPWAVEEVAWFCEQIKEAEEQKLDDKALTKRLKEQVEAMRQALAGGLDIALSGRMATSGLLSELGKVDGALAVAHVITTHTVDADIDWFTAVDDLQELGSGHLDTQEFSSGVFYRYASLNITQLQDNLGNASREKVLEIAAHVLHLMATVVPSAKQQSFAAHNLADLAMVSFSDIPISLANAFEEPVRPAPGYIKPSVKALHGYWQAIHSGYGLEERCAQFSLGHERPKDIKEQETLENLKEWVKFNGEG